MTNKKTVKEELKEITEREIEKEEIMIAFYTQKAEKQEDKEEKAKTLLKVEQLKSNLEFNKEFKDFINN